MLRDNLWMPFYKTIEPQQMVFYIAANHLIHEPKDA